MPIKAQLFDDGDDQILRLPEGFEFPGTEVEIWRDGDQVLIKAVEATAEQIAALKADIEAGLDSGPAEPWNLAEIKSAARAEFALAKAA